MTDIFKKLKHNFLLLVSAKYKREHEQRVERQEAILRNLRQSKDELIARTEILIEQQFAVLRRLRARHSQLTPLSELRYTDELQRKIVFNQARLKAVKENRKSHEIDVSEYMETMRYLLDKDTEEINSIVISNRPPFFPIPRKSDSHP